MHRLSRVPLIVVLLLGAPALAGCLGDETAPPPGPDHDEVAPAGDRGPLRLVTAEGDVRIDRWLDLPAERDLPSVLRLGQVDHWETDQGAMRLLTDGQAFVLLVDQSIERYAEGTVVFTRVYTTDGGTVATGLWVSRDDGQAQVALALTPNDIMRFGVAYRSEVIVFVPDGPPDCRCSAASDENEVGLEIGMFSRRAVAMEEHANPRVPTNAWNGTIVHHRDRPLSFYPSWEIGFEGPSTGTDRPDALERQLFGGPEKGRYTFTFTGERVWLMDVLFEFDRSRIAGTEPHARGNGSSSLHIQLDGWRPLEAYAAMAPSKGLEQTFTLQVDIDYETRDDLPAEEDQRFFLTAAVGYRLGGSTYVAETDGRDLDVRVAQDV